MTTVSDSNASLSPNAAGMRRGEPVETVLVTGGTGFVASWCIAGLLRRGFNVRATVRSLSKEQSVRAALAAAGVDAGERLTFAAADLTADSGWEAAAEGCEYAMHVASPLGGGGAGEAAALIDAARGGTLRVLHAAAKAGVRRVVMTSSCAAATPSRYREETVIDESLWSDPEHNSFDAYRKSKTLAEMDAWQFMRERGGSLSLATVLPGAIFGPVLSADNPGSVQVIGRLLQGRIPGTPRLGFEIVDVRDLAELHIRAMLSDAAAGQRFIAVGDFMWMSDIARLLRAKLGAAAGKVPARALPDFALRLFSLFDPSLRSVTPMLGRKYRHTPEKAHRLLGWQSRPAAETVVDCAESLLARKLI